MIENDTLSMDLRDITKASGAGHRIPVTASIEMERREAGMEPRQ